MCGSLGWLGRGEWDGAINGYKEEKESLLFISYYCMNHSKNSMTDMMQISVVKDYLTLDV